MGIKKKRASAGEQAQKRPGKSSKKPAIARAGRENSAARSVDEVEPVEPDKVEPESAEDTLAFSVVGIGASAGGLEAFTRLLQALPVDTGMAFVLVQHLAPHRESALAEILTRATKMPVVEVQGEPELEPNRVYVIPPDRNMLIDRGRLRLIKREAQGKQHPIDRFFSSLAEHQHHLAIGVVLSGTATDGTLGLEEIKAEGGITFAQDGSAQQPGMPQSAVASGCVDFVLTPEAIAAEIARIGKHPYLRVRRVRGGREAARLAAAHDKASLAPILKLLRGATGVDFSQYKINTLQRRISRRMLLQRKEGIDAYADFARKNRKELDALYQDILISVTGFFRDPEMYEALKSSVLPALLADRSAEEPLRVWVLGCSTGEEAYSYAMILTEVLEGAHESTSAQVFATDLNASSIERARAGVYARDRLHSVSRERLRRFFVEQNGDLRVSKSIRDMCVFSPHNVMTDPPFSRMDIVSCRNLLIYLEPELQQRVLPVLHYALKPKGFLVLGASESVGRFGDLFVASDGKQKIFAKKAGSGGVPRMPLVNARTAAGADSKAKPPPVDGMARSAVRWATLPSTDVHKEADRLLATFAPPAVLVNSEFEILQFRGDTEPFLAPSQGKASHALLKMAREELRVPLRTLLHRAKKENAPVREDGVRIKSLGRRREVSLEVLPVRGATTLDGCLLVLFLESGAERDPRPKAVALRPAASEPSNANVARLEQELASTREHLQALMEQFEAANEELQSSNEEAQSANEELQSINEELETSKEEIQSSNEELTTVNEELRNRNTELGQLNSDLTNLINGVHMAVVIVGRDLRIRRFSPLAEKLLSIIPTDVGRSISDIRTKLVVPDLDALLTGAIDTVTPFERDVKGGDGRWYSVRIRPYLTVDNRIDGAVLSLVDIDSIRRAKDYAETIVETVRRPLLVLDSKLRVQRAGRAFFDAFQLTREAVEGQPFLELDDAQWDTPPLRRSLDELLRDGVAFDDLEVAREFPRVGRRTLRLNARRLQLPEDNRLSILLSIDDITDQSQTLNALKLSELRYRRLFESSKDGIVILDFESARITDVNPSLAELLGYSVEELLGKELWEIGLFPDAAASKRAVQALQKDGYLRYEDLPLKTHDGRSIDVEFVSNVYSQGERPLIQCHIREITERKRLEFELQQRNADLAAADAAKDNFLAALSHELRSPLNIVLLWSQIIGRPGVSPDTLRTGIDIIEQSAHSQARLIEDLLDVHRISTGAVRLELEVMDLVGVVRSVVESMKPSAAERDLRVTLECELSSAPLSGDAARLQQVFRNLLGNAIKFTPRGGDIHICLARRRSFVEVAVRDTGCGIEAARLSQIFERFRPLDPRTPPGSSGLGLGLIIAKRLVELHGGSLSAASPGEGAGSTFTVSLPLRTATTAKKAPSRRRPMAQAASAAEPSLAGALVLVVDDDREMREAVRRVLEAAGARTHSAATADRALESIHIQRPDVILSDIGMPGRDGYEFLRELRALPARRGGRTPAIALTAHARAEDRESAREAGFDDHLAKPVDAAKLLETVAAVLARARGKARASKVDAAKPRRRR
jgi:two-component system CheB/CheR fusion protein